MILVATMAIHVHIIFEPLPFLIPPTPPLLPGELVTWGREQVSEQSHNSSVYGSPAYPRLPPPITHLQHFTLECTR